jgi:hypothetical protein
MSIQRSDIRIFGLLATALIVTVLLYAGISTANAEGTILGTKIIITGPIAAFVTLLLVFKLIGIFEMDLGELSVSKVEPRKLNKNELVNELDVLEIKIKRLVRRKDEISNMVTALDDNKTYTDIVSAGGMRRATRGG